VDAAAPVNVLVVDDREANRAALKAMLASPDYHVVEAGGGAEALRRLLDDDFAVVLADVIMPEMSGFELAAVIRERDRTSALPILLMTAAAWDVDFVVQGYRAGAIDFLVKPLVPEIVRAKVGVFAELHRRKRRLVEVERQENELRLVEQHLAGERRYRSLAEAVPHIIWTARADGTIDYFNQRWFEYTGISAAEAAGSFRAAVHPEDVDRCLAAWRHAIGSREPFDAECRLRQGVGGAYRWHLGRAVPERSAAGNVTSWLGTFTDIEDQKRVESALAELTGTLDAVLDAVLIFEPRTFRLDYANQGACALLGRSRADLAGARPVDVLADYDEARFRDLVAPLVDGVKKRVAVEARFRRPGDADVPVEISFQLVRTDGGHMVSIARDITDRKLAELEREQLYREAVDAVRTRDDFLSVASHELRTPLSSLQLSIEMLIRPPRGAPPLSSEKARARLETAARQVDKLTQLLGKLLDVSRIREGRLALELEPVDLAAVARDVVSRLAHDAERAGSTITLDAPEPVVGTWDRMRLEQVTTNLVSNALKYGEGKPVEIMVAGDGARAMLVVRDHGIGIEGDEVGRILGRFERGKGARAYGGLGLGLYIARQIVEAHRGTIRVESEAGVGSTFTVDLPRESSAA
jgi:PAS domain S-box-containing protein